ncbi:piggyBac transposable element-derived protein 3 [Anabrus simplex]|uniref:piggyBac transposable element-derived protein 3 n=1 Tax=Anabrus simplex TaxID=316456 RepID=UPI0035A2D66E
MERVCFIKCEPENPLDINESCDSLSEAETHSSNLLKGKVEPDLTYSHPDVQMEVSELRIKEEPTNQETHLEVDCNHIKTEQDFETVSLLNAERETSPSEFCQDLRKEVKEVVEEEDSETTGPLLKRLTRNCSEYRVLKVYPSLTRNKITNLLDAHKEDSDIEASDDSEIDNVEENDQDSESEQESSDCESGDTGASESECDIPASYRSLFYEGKDGTKWYSKAPPRNIRTRVQNIVTHLPGPKDRARSARTPTECFSLLIDDKILDLIVSYTNKYIETVKQQFSRARDVTLTDRGEIRALFGLLYHAGMLRSARLHTDDLWATDGSGIDIFIATMSRKRFLFLLRCIRFDDIHTRSERRKLDKLSPIREIFELFNANIKEHYTIGEHAILGEKLEPFRGRCSFKQYKKSKAKYGIKTFLLVCARTFYTINMEIYAGLQPEGPYRCDNKPSSIVMRLIEPIDKTGRNLTMDNWFMSIPLATDLLVNHRITCVGTIKKNEREIPPEFMKTKGKEVCSSMFGFTEHVTLTSYVPKKGRVVLLVSTMHRDAAIDGESGAKKNPEMMTLYNGTKDGVDTVDKMCGTYTVSRKSSRWPLTIFFGILNIAAINAQIIYKANSLNSEPTFHRNFLKRLSLDLTKEHLASRSKILSLPTNLRSRIQWLTGISEERKITVLGKRQAGRCKDCGSKKNRKTRTCCIICEKLICREHVKPMCGDCLEQVNEQQEGMG